MPPIEDEKVYNRYAVDIPDNIRKDEWVNVETFATKEEAIEFAMENFGADEEGKICLVSGPF